MSNTDYIIITLNIEWRRLECIKRHYNDADLRADVDTVMASIEGILRYIAGDAMVNSMIIDAMFPRAEQIAAE